MLRRCFKIIENHIEDDFECYGVSYHLTYEKGKIKFIRTTTSPTYEYNGFGAIDTKSSDFVMFEEEADLVDFTNMVINYANHQCEYHYEFGARETSIHFRPVTKIDEV